MIVVEVNYDEYALVQVVATKGQPLTVVNKLYGQSVSVPHKCWLHVFISLEFDSLPYKHVYI